MKNKYVSKIAALLFLIVFLAPSTAAARPAYYEQQALDQLFVYFFITVAVLLATVCIMLYYSWNYKLQTEKKTEELKRNLEALKQTEEELRSSNEEIDKMNAILEQKVIERTAQLENTNTELKSALETIQKTQAYLIQSEKLAALGSLVAGVAHEVNTPIGVGVTASSYLRGKTLELSKMYEQHGITEEDFAKFLDISLESTNIICTNLQNASKLVQSFKKIAVDQTHEDKCRFKLRPYINDVILSLKHILKKRSISINIECDNNLEIYSYPGTISQIISNMIMNSLIHAYDEGSEGTISISAQIDNDTLTLMYSDDGKGIEPDILNRIYEPFFTTKRGSGGSGLGLNIVYNLISQQLKGTIICESSIGAGTAFTITVPISK